MRVLVDADACPVKRIVEEECSKRNISVLMFIDTSHVLQSDYSKIITVSKGIDSVDLRIIKDLEKGDIVVTQDFGLASLVLAAKAYPINQNGLIFTENNIEQLLFERYISGENRRKGIRMKNMSKRNSSTDVIFRQSFISLIDKK